MTGQENGISFFSRIDEAIAAETAFTAYKKPGSKLVHALFQEDSILHEMNSFEDEGFVFAPFDNRRKSILIPLEKSDKITVEIGELPEVESGELTNSPTLNEERKAHLGLVSKCLEQIENEQFDKVVLSRKEIVSTGDVDVNLLFKRLLVKYPSAFVYVWSHPHVGTWFGASPEKLLEVQGNVFKTMALAGTKVFKGTMDVNWEDKELQEQQFVTDYMLNQLAENGALKVSSVSTVKAGSLLHLRTDIEGVLSRDDKGLSVEQLLNALHPTPATCGLPKEEAKQFILKNESYNREFYTGYLGELNFGNHSNIYVNLRCMKMESGKISIYIGGGITMGSNPQKEWDETVAKSRIMKSVLY